MAALIPPFSKSELLDEVRTIMATFAFEIGRMYAPSADLSMAGAAPQTIAKSATNPTNPAEHSAPFPPEVEEVIDLDKLRITPFASALYDFAFEGRYDPLLDWSAVCEDLYPFLRAVEAHETVVDRAGTPRLLRLVLELGVARAVVNGDCEEIIPIRPPEREEPDTRFGGFLPLRQVALLASVDEKTVRNASANPKAPLKSKSIGGRAYFAVDDVREWLDKRGQLLPTVMVNPSATRDLRAQPFTSAEDLALFLEDRRATVGVAWDATDASGQRRIPELALAWTAPAQPMTSPSFDLEAALALADALQLPAGDFVPAVLELFQKIEQERVRAELRTRLGGEKQ